MKECDCCEELVENVTRIGEYDVCESCEENMENVTGYCSVSCQLGFGCDESC